MLQPGSHLQNRYRIIRQIGGGGMAVVYLAEDTRLVGRHCAVKEMSPAELAPRDRGWALDAFEREAQMLARLHDSGLTAVTDFFSEAGNWYLVMDYVEGETLQQRLERAPKGRLPLEEALDIARQLCKVLKYLHGQNPPVVFRDLKPSNVMITPDGKVKLIDFGIARFFKGGQGEDTVLLGTPGYAAPEQYGGAGQSDPRADIYSLGVLLHQMVTGHNPTTSPTPFSLPSPGDLRRDLPPHVEEVLSRATRVHPDLRYNSVEELRRALFPPTWVLPQQGRASAEPYRAAGAQAQAGSADTGALGRGIWVAVGVGAILLVGVCALTVALILPNLDGLSAIFVQPTKQSPTVTLRPTNTHNVPATATSTETASPETASPETAPPTTAPPTPLPTTDTPTPPPSPTFARKNIGRSIRNRDLEVVEIGYERGTAVAVIGSIEGDQPTTADLVRASIEYFDRERETVPRDVLFAFMPTLNPDGNATNSRYNANGVDLNRNWGSRDWRSRAAVPGHPDGKAGAGGSRPFSEPETDALRNYLGDLRSRSSTLRVVVFHSSVRRSEGEVYPGGNSALDIAEVYARDAGYDIETAWAEYTTSGELVTWCEEEGIPSIDIVIPASQGPYSQVSGNRTLRDVTVEALLDVAEYR